jgi:hypothetical protein
MFPRLTKLKSASNYDIMVYSRGAQHTARGPGPARGVRQSGPVEIFQNNIVLPETDFSVNKIIKINKSKLKYIYFLKFWACIVYKTRTNLMLINERFKKIPLSRNAMQRRVQDIAGNLNNQLMDKMSDFKHYSLALDESTYITDTAQVLLFIRGVDQDFNIVEELAGMQSLKGTATAKYMCDSVVQCITEKLSYSFDK